MTPSATRRTPTGKGPTGTRDGALGRGNRAAALLTGIVSHLDCCPRCWPPPGNGHQAEVLEVNTVGSKTFKGHLVATTCSTTGTGKTDTSPGWINFYFSDDGDLHRPCVYDNWKFVVQWSKRCTGTLQILGWNRSPFCASPRSLTCSPIPTRRATSLQNLTGIGCWTTVFCFDPAQAAVAKALEKPFKEFPLARRRPSFTVGDASEKRTSTLGSS